MKRVHDEKIQAIVPVYTEYGDTTYVYTKEQNKILYPNTIRTFIKNLLKFYMIDFSALKTKFRDLGIKQNIPLIIDNQVLVKVKVRKPIGKSDGAYGYINISELKRIQVEKTVTYIVFKDGYRLKTLDSRTTLSKNILTGHEIKNILDSRFWKVCEFMKINHIICF